MIDLTFSLREKCDLHRLARSLNLGFFSAEATGCEFTKDLTTREVIFAPAIKFPRQTPFNAVISFASASQPNVSNPILCMVDKQSRFDRVVEASQEFETEYIFSLPEPMNAVQFGTNLFKLWTHIQPKWLAFLAKAPVMQSIMPVFATVHMNPILQTPIILYDDGIQANKCDVTCRKIGNLTRKCGTPGKTVSFSCIKPDISIRNEVDLERIQLSLKDLWSNSGLNKMDILYAYETVISAGLVMNSTIMNGSWPQSKNGTTRYRNFMETVKQLPPRISTVGEINFNSSTVNQNPAFRLHQCTVVNDSSDVTCVNTNVSFQYWERKFVSSHLIPSITRDYVLRVLVIHEPPFCIKTESGWTGFTIEVFETIANILNLRYEYAEQPRLTNRTSDQTLDWTGLISKVKSKAADIGLGPVMGTDERRKLIDFTIPYSETSGISLVVKKKKLHELAVTYFVDLFTLNVWLTLIAMMIAVSVFFWIAVKVSPYSLHNQEHPLIEPPATQLSWLQSVWLVLGAAVGQGESVDSWTFSGKLIAGGLIIFTVFSTKFLIINMFARATDRVDTVESLTVTSLIYQSAVQFTMRINSNEMVFFEVNHQAEDFLFDNWWQKFTAFTQWSPSNSLWLYPMSEHYGTAHNRMLEWSLTQTHEQSIELVRKGWIVFMETLMAEYYVGQTCDLQIVDAGFGSWNFGFLLPLNSPLTNLFDELIMRMWLNGQMKLLEAKWWIPIPESCLLELEKGLGLYEFQATFILFAVGIGLTLIFLAIECIVHFNEKMKKRKKLDEKMNTSEGNSGVDEPQTNAESLSNF
ncbi:hypothetical protein D915_000648 [Fasciola hepatica]|uniref:Ionotropic glutamate receptor C-terminal domain-containing protein n=1 Tax=Fasciola hepatica TaxID=6192 RepID=A0A4E0RRE0_FASHE|nr:hypothetical protein D915_000648 [Fasciola hepatica]